MRDVTEILVHWQSGRSLKKIVRSLGVSRTVRKYVELARSLGFQQGEAELSASEWAAVLKEKAPGLFDAATRSREERRVPRVAFWAIDSERPIVRRMSVFGQDRSITWPKRPCRGSYAWPLTLSHRAVAWTMHSTSTAPPAWHALQCGTPTPLASLRR